MPLGVTSTDKKEKGFSLSSHRGIAGNKTHMTDNNPTQVQPERSATHAHAKWFLVHDDVSLSVPAPVVRVSVIKAQASIAPGKRLVRDHNSPNDVLLNDDQTVDLREGNVFYTLDAEDIEGERDHCSQPAKLAMLVDDRAEIIGTPHQHGRSIRDLFDIPVGSLLFRDLDTPHDEPIADDQVVEYGDGPVFYSRHHQKTILSIVVNKKTFTAENGVKEEMTGLAIASLVSQNPAQTDVYKREGGTRKAVGLHETIRVMTGDEFDVIRQQVQGGFEPTRIERELNILRVGGANVVFHGGTPAAVVYHDLPVRAGNSVGVAKSDVLVLVPSGYPAQAIDCAFLPQGSPLLGRVPGAPQYAVVVGGCAWTQVSYHPHNGGGGPPWNKDCLGFHTYIDELLAWLDKAQ